MEPVTDNFSNRYVFPDGELVTVGNVDRRMENVQCGIWGVEVLRPHDATRAEALRHRAAVLRAIRLRIETALNLKHWRGVSGEK
ncbi:MAG: class I SAM-dependent methyltransferase [Betaproteobacteria bacterium]|nr:class I SAM-dependent methyltransferase [Betaproteobacteria bacterium]